MAHWQESYVSEPRRVLVARRILEYIMEFWRVHIPYSGWQYFDNEEAAQKCADDRSYIRNGSKPQKITLLQIIQEISDTFQKIEDDRRGPMS